MKPYKIYLSLNIIAELALIGLFLRPDELEMAGPFVFITLLLFVHGLLMLGLSFVNWKNKINIFYILIVPQYIYSGIFVLLLCSGIYTLFGGKL